MVTVLANRAGQSFSLTRIIIVQRLLFLSDTGLDSYQTKSDKFRTEHTNDNSWVIGGTIDES